jgi:3-hydroxybutyryl-CoA dehydratase
MSVTSTIGAHTTFRKTVSESDVYLFAGITGDFSSNHVDEAYMATTTYGKRIAHGALLVGYMSGASTAIIAKCPDMSAFHPVSLGYDRIRFLKAVFIGDTISISYRITSANEAKLRTTADVEVTNQHGELCAVANHILRWLDKDQAVPAT